MLWSICVFSEQEHLLLQLFNTSHCIFRILFFFKQIRNNGLIA